MKLYGYANGDNADTLLELNNVAICFQHPEDARKFANFAMACADKMTAMGDAYDHVHFGGGETPDITIEQLVGSNS